MVKYAISVKVILSVIEKFGQKFQQPRAYLFRNFAFPQNTKTTLLHIESRQSRAKNRQFELFLEVQGSKENLVSVANALRQSPAVQDGCVTVVGEKPANKKGQLSDLLIPSPSY